MSGIWSTKRKKNGRRDTCLINLKIKYGVCHMRANKMQPLTHKNDIGRWNINMSRRGKCCRLFCVFPHTQTHRGSRKQKRYENTAGEQEQRRYTQWEQRKMIETSKVKQISRLHVCLHELKRKRKKKQEKEWMCACLQFSTCIVETRVHITLDARRNLKKRCSGVGSKGRTKNTCRNRTPQTEKKVK